MRAAALALVLASAVFVSLGGCILRPKQPHDVPRQTRAETCPSAPLSWRPGCYHPGAPPEPDSRFAGSIDPNATLRIRQAANVIEQHMPTIEYCYKRQLRCRRGLEGKVAVTWTLGPSGNVSGFWTGGSTLGSQPVIDCIGHEICGWQFPAPDRPEAVVKWTFVFKED